VDKRTLLAVFSDYVQNRLDPMSDDELSISKKERSELVRLRKSIDEFE
jgi:hypothetical protein